jgi:two-component system OmpR family sensor kinase
MKQRLKALRRRLTPRSLRARLIVGVILLAAFSLTLMMGALYAEQRSFTYDRVDDQARAAVFPVNRALSERGVEGGDTRPDGPLPDGPGLGAGPGGRRSGPTGALAPGTYGQRRSPSGEVLGSVLLGVGSTQPSPPQLPADLPEGELITVPAVSGDPDYRVFSVTDPRGYTTITAAPLTDAQDQLSRLLVSGILLLGSGLALMALFAWWLIAHALKPLDEMADTAGAIAGGDLSQRVAQSDEETEVGRLGGALNVMLSQIERSFAAQKASEEQLRRFLADASHELRTPLAAIRGYAELHRMGAANTPEEVSHSMGRIESESARMGVLVEDLLKLARLDEQREPVRVPVPVVRVAEDAVSDAQAADQTGRRIALHTSGLAHDAVIYGDCDGLRQVLGNLLGNALMHTPPGSPIDVSLIGESRVVQLTVRDHGPGLPTDDGSKLFERFWRAAPGRERGPGGAGLGLAIVAAIVESHGGSVSAANAEGGGADFTVTLPTGSSQDG